MTDGPPDSATPGIPERGQKKRTAVEPTPPGRHPFHELPNVLMTPHVSGWTEGMLAARAQVIADNIARTVRGEPPLNRIVRS